MTIEYLFFQGDSYPADEPVRAAFERQLNAPLVMIESGPPSSVPQRLSRLRDYLAFRPSSRFVLIGRSSGCRVATQIACEPQFARRILAVVAASYPFKHPERDVEPERFRHLPDLKTPCLIIQARSDEYGGENEIRNYALSAATRVHLVEGYHELKISPSAMRDVGDAVRRFLKDADVPPPRRDFPSNDASYWPCLGRKLG